MRKNIEVAYFSMEIGINSEIKTYSGGLGVLAGDMLKSAADINYPMTGVTLLYNEGYIKQKLDEQKGQIEEPENWNPSNYLNKLEPQLEVEIADETVKFQIWEYDIPESVKILFLDTNISENSEFAKNLTKTLYPSGREQRLAQEILLGIGGTKAVKELEAEHDIYHMNEGHSSLLTVQLLKQHKQQGKNIEEAKKCIKNSCVFTTHTPVPAGHDIFDQHVVEKLMGENYSSLKELGFENQLNTTELAMKYSFFTNAVSKKHEEVSEEMFPEEDLSSVVNGIHSKTWTNRHLAELLDQKIPYWHEDPQRLSMIDKLTNEEIWNSHQKAKKELITEINQQKDRELQEDVLTLGFARRATSYKRMNLLFKDLEKLDQMAEQYNGLQIVMAGKAHPDDTAGKELIKDVLRYRDLLNETEVVFLENYNMEKGKMMTSGVDVWVNTPVRGKEASGTSGMKAAHNGVPQLSVLDGWWLEGHIEDKTGWSIGENYVEGEDQDNIDSQSIYRKLEKILTLYHNEREQWIDIMKNSIKINASYFNTERMLKDYISKAYSQK